MTSTRVIAAAATALLAALATAALATACGISTQSSPQRLATKLIPFGLMETTTSTTAVPQPSQAIMEVFLVSATHLVAVDRVVSAPVGISDALSSLLAGPSNLEEFSGTSTAIPSGTSIRSVRESAATVTIDLSESFAAVSGQTQILAIAQIVYTATQLFGIDRVNFELNGTGTEVPAADGTLLQRPVERSDYAPLAPGIPIAAKH